MRELLLTLSLAFGPIPAAAGSGPPAAEAEAQAGLEEARGTFQTLVDSWLQVRGHSSGSVRLRDPDTGRMIPLRLLRADPTTVHAEGPGLYSGDVIFVDEKGRKVRAKAVEDMRTAQWTISSLELPSRKRAEAAAKDAGKLFGAAVLEYVQAAVNRDGAFYFQEDATKRRQRLKLKMLPTDAVSRVDGERVRSPVHFSDLDSGAAVTVDFFVNIAGESGRVYKTAAAAPDP